MKNQLPTSQTKAVLLALVLSFSFGCGKSNTPTSTSTSATALANSSTNLAYCNLASSTATKFNTMAYIENSQVRTDLLRLKFSSMNSSFFNSGSVLQFFRWKADSLNQTSTDTTPLSFRVIKTSTNTEVFSGNSMVFTDISGSVTGQDLSSLYLVIDTRDTSALYDVLRMVVYTSTNLIVENMDSLIPAFSANPNDYATKWDGTTRSTLLQTLHPFKSQISSGLSSAQFAVQAQAYCF